MFQLVSKRATQLGLVFLLIAAFNQAFSQQNTVASLVKPDGSSRSDKVAKPDSKESNDLTSFLASFVATENRVREALNQHTFKRDVILQTIGPNGEVTGEYIRNSQFLFDDRGKRIEKVLFHPASTIREMRITKEDIQDLAGSQLLGIDIVEATKYRLSYVGAETIDSRQLLAIDVTPLQEPNPKRMSERYFVGRVWVDPTTFQIVKIKGIVEPQGKQRFPIFETWREPIKNALAFPTRTEADDILHFGDLDVHYRIKVRYYDYKLFGSKVSITEIDEPFPDVNEATPKANEAPPKMNQAPPKSNEASPKVKESYPKLSEKPATQLPLPNIQPRTKPEVCTTNRNAPPVGAYHWPANTEVKVYFVRNMFTAEQSATLLEAMKTWTVSGQEDGSGVKFTYAGETESRMNCRSCLTVGRRDVYKQDKHHYAFFNPMQEEGQLLVSAWIDLDVGIKEPKALQGFMAHELGHGLGLWDCPSCKKKQSLMNSFPGLNQNNGLVGPSSCDLATMRNVYQEERQIAAANSYGDKRTEAVRTDNTSTLPLADLERAGFSALDLQRSLIGGAATAKPSGDRRPQTVPVDRTLALPPPRLDLTSFSAPDFRHPTIDIKAPVNPFGDKRPGTGRADNALTLKPLSLNKASFYLFDLHHPRVNRSLFLWDRIF
jgi:hypothetical protein